MHRVTLGMELSSDDAYVYVEQALATIPNVTLTRTTGESEPNNILVTIDTDDPDLVDIVREIAWEYDPTAVQHSLQLTEVS
jgi:hypothetical protein